MTVEKKLERRLRRKVEQMGGRAIKLQSDSFHGLPDRLILMPNASASFVELKSKGIKPTPRQLYVHKQIRRLGFHVAVIDSGELLNEFLEHLDYEQKPKT